MSFIRNWGLAKCKDVTLRKRHLKFLVLFFRKEGCSGEWIEEWACLSVCCLLLLSEFGIHSFIQEIFTAGGNSVWHHATRIQIQASYLTVLCLHFFICKTAVMLDRSWQGAEDFLFIPALGMESRMWVNNKMGFFLWGVYPGVLTLAAGAL